MRSTLSGWRSLIVCKCCCKQGRTCSGATAVHLARCLLTTCLRTTAPQSLALVRQVAPARICTFRAHACPSRRAQGRRHCTCLQLDNAKRYACTMSEGGARHADYLLGLLQSLLAQGELRRRRQTTQPLQAALLVTTIMCYRVQRVLRGHGRNAPAHMPTWRPRPRPRWRPAPQAAPCATCRTRRTAPRTAGRCAPACAPAASSGCVTGPSSAQEPTCRHSTLCCDQGSAGLPSYPAEQQAPHGEDAGMSEYAGRQARFHLLRASRPSIPGSPIGTAPRRPPPLSPAIIPAGVKF